MKEEKVVRLNWALFFALLFYILTSIGFSVYAYATDLKIRLWPALVLSQIMVWTAFLLGVVICKAKIFDKDMFRIKQSIPVLMVNLLLSLIFFAGFMPTCWFLNYLTQLFASNQLQTETELMNNYPLYEQLFFIAVIPGVSEELLVRGAVYSRLRHYSTIKAVIISAVFFGLLHLNINQFAYTMALGIFVALLNECTGYIYSSMLAHFMMNSFAVVIVHVLGKMVSSEAVIMKVVAEVSGGTTATSVRDLPVASIIITLIILGGMALAGLSIAIGVLVLLAYINKREGGFRGIFAKSEVKMFTGGFYAMLALGMTYMIVTEYFLKI